MSIKLILASASPRRLDLLRQVGVEPEIQVAEVAELTNELPPAELVQANARLKAEAVAALQPQNGAEAAEVYIVAADTVVALEGDILGKPRHTAHALEMLSRLAGRGHEVVSAVCLLPPPGWPGKPCELFSDASRVFFHAWPRSVLAAYARTHEPDDKAGAYALQGQGAFLVERVEGSWSTVVGLPVTPLTRMLMERGLIFPAD